MPEFCFEFFVAVHGQDWLAGEANDSSGALDESAAKGCHFAEAPQRGAFCRGAPGAGVELDLEFASSAVASRGPR